MKMPIFLLSLFTITVSAQRPEIPEKIHDKDRALPPVVEPKPYRPAPPPEGAVVLFEPKDLFGKK